MNLKEASPTEEPLHRATIRACVVQGSLTRHELISSKQWPIRYTHRCIKSVRDLKETLRAGPYAWPGGYPLYFITADNEPLSFKSALENYETIVHSMSVDYGAPTWRIVGCEINEEDFDLRCSHSGELIESAVEPEDDGEDFIRASGSAICTICQQPYLRHPLDYTGIGPGNAPYLNVLCDGTKVKL